MGERTPRLDDVKERNSHSTSSRVSGENALNEGVATG